MSLPRFALLVLLALAAALPAPLLAETASGPTAATPDDAALSPVSIAAFGQVLQFDPMFDVLRQEGIAQAGELAQMMLLRSGGPAWDRAVSDIYDLRRLRARFNQALRAQLAPDPATTAEIMAFFASDLGQRLLTMEIEARRAFLDIANEEAAKVAADTPETARDPKWRLIARLIAAGDLVEMNVAAGLSGSLAFTLGLQETGATGQRLPLDQLAPEVWSQEEQLRADTSVWLKAYFGLAYAALTEAELETYVVFMESPAGQRFSSALFVAFDATFHRISRDLGKAVGNAMQAHEI